MLMETLSLDWFKARQTNTTDNGFPSRIPTGTPPAGTGDSAAQATASGVYNLGSPDGSKTQNALILVPYGTGSDNNTFSLRVLGWRVIGNDPNTLLWVPVNLCELAVTLSTAVGVAGRQVVATERFADTISQTTGSTTSVDIGSPADNTIAHAMIDLKGFQKVEVTFTTGASATDCNALLALI